MFTRHHDPHFSIRASVLIALLFFQFARSALPDTVPELLFRQHVVPEAGGKVPEAAHLRKELNELDAMGFAENEAEAEAMVEAMKDMPLPEKMPKEGEVALAPAHSPSLPGRPHSPYHPGPG